MEKHPGHRSYTVLTTTLVVECPTNFSLLEQHYRLFRYELPQQLLERSTAFQSTQRATLKKEQEKLYVRLHADLRKAFSNPYKAYKHDMLDGRQKWVIYTLVPHTSSPQVLSLSPALLGKGASIQGREVVWDQAPLHIVLKLLQIAYIHGNTPRYFIGEDDCYMYAKTFERSDGSLVDICLKIQLQGQRKNQTQESFQHFYAVPRACPFRIDQQPRPGMKTYYARRIRQDKVYYIQLQPAEIDRFHTQRKPLYTILSSTGKRATLPYLDLVRIESSTGTLLHDFLQYYTAFLQTYGICCHFKTHTFTEWPPLSPVAAQLPIHLLQTIGLFDNRLQAQFLTPPQQQIPFDSYIQLMRAIVVRISPHIRIVPIANLSQAQKEHLPTLILQDYEEGDFKEDGCLFGHVDPYHTVYQTFPFLVKQSLNVNPHSQEERTSADQSLSSAASIDHYFQYETPDKDEILFNYKVETSLFQLYLKDVIMQKRSVQERLPSFPMPYCFLRKLHINQKDYEILLTIEHDQLQFTNLRTLPGKKRCIQYLQRLGIDWTAMRQHMQEKYSQQSETGEEDDIPSYHAVAGKGFFVEIEDLNERLLYNAAEIRQRQQALQKPRPLEDFKLVSHFASLRPKDRAKEQQRYLQFLHYDQFLEELKQQYEMISFRQLTQQEYMQRIGPILGEKRNTEGYYSRMRLKGYYRKIGMFPSDKANELHLFKGVWYDAADQCYLIGSPQSLHYVQDKPTLIRCFDLYQEREKFDPASLLNAMTVQFVRFRQYTVYPYPFNLIDLYVEHLGRFSALPEVF